jgi:c(7)-type cytochrome triheme protein
MNTVSARRKSMNKAGRISRLFVALAVAMCVLAASAALASEQAEEAEPVKPREEVLQSLPCFECHSLQKYMSAPALGVFSHELHGMFDLHCNACHDIAGHEMPRLKSEACGSCHSMSVFEYTGGGMGKVKFNHEAHGAMFSCGKCHPDAFPMKRGGAKMKMNPMYEGKSCGFCHDGQMAFASRDCMRCHGTGK